MPQFPFSITFSAAEMCAKFTGLGEPQPLLSTTTTTQFIWQRSEWWRSQLIFIFFIIMKACQIKLIFPHTRGLVFPVRQSEVSVREMRWPVVTLARLTRSTPLLWGRQCHKSIWRAAALVCTYVTRLVSATREKGHLLVVAVRRREIDRLWEREIERAGRPFCCRTSAGLTSNRPHITCKLRQLFSASFLAS